MTTATRFAYFYLMSDDRERVRNAVPSHVSYWNELGLERYVGGPFEDRTGGLITFAAQGLSRAQRFVEGDPFVREGLLQRYWLKEWVPE